MSEKVIPPEIPGPCLSCLVRCAPNCNQLTVEQRKELLQLVVDTSLHRDRQPRL